MKKNLKTIVMLSLAIISVVAVTFAFSGAWFTDSDSKTATITVGKKVEISVDATVPEDTTILPGSKFEITDIVGVAAADVSSMYVRASVEVENTYANVLTPTTTSTGWVELDGYFYYSSADSLTADSTLSNLTELVAGNSTGSLNLTLNVSREATQEPTDETYLAPGATVTVTITFEAIQSANTDKKTIKQIWGAFSVALNIDGEEVNVDIARTATLQDVINVYNATAETDLTDSTTCGWFADAALTQAITPTAVNDYSNINIMDYNGFYTRQVSEEMLSSLTFTLESTLNVYLVSGNNNAVTEVIIPSAYGEGNDCCRVALLNYSAFADYTSLKNITLSNSVEIIGCIRYVSNHARVYGSAFKNCSSLTNINIHNKVSGIMSNSFQNCTSLKSIIIPASVTGISSYAFDGCTSLTDVFYSGTLENKASVDIDNTDSANDYLINATWHYAGEWGFVDGVPTVIS